MSQIGTPVYTIGYGNRPWPEFLHLLFKHNIDTLVDVRSQPWSKHRPEFKKSALSQELARNGLSYHFLGDLLGGRPSDKSCYRDDGTVDYNKVKMSGFFKQGFSALLDLLGTGKTVVLMCGELEAQRCHRKQLITPLLEAKGVKVVHL